MILELVQFSLREDAVNRVEDVALEARRSGHGRDGGVGRFLEDVVEHFFILRQWAGDEKAAARLDDTVCLAKGEFQIGGVIDRKGAGA